MWVRRHEKFFKESKDREKQRVVRARLSKSGRPVTTVKLEISLKKEEKKREKAEAGKNEKKKDLVCRRMDLGRALRAASKSG